MQATFFFIRRFPPPAAGAHIFAGLNRARAGRTADTRKTAVVQHVVRHAVGTDVNLKIIQRPVDQRVEFGQAGLRVKPRFAHLCA